ncbi:MAG: HAD family hydrolase [Alkalispirochaeta sp.]
MGTDKRSTSESVIFDLDGTLLDTLEDIADAMNRALERNGYPGATLAVYRTRVGWGLSELVRRSLPEDDAASPEVVAAIAGAFREIHFAEPVIKTRPYPGIVGIVRDLYRRGVPMFVYTNKPDGIAGAVVDTLFSPEALEIDGPPFIRVLGQRDDIPRKPDPTGAFTLLDEAGLSPGFCRFVGDSEIDIETARNAGCIAIGVTWGFRDTDTIERAEPDHICYSSDDLRRVLALDETDLHPRGGAQ